MKNYYKILDVPSDATAQEIRKSFRALAVRYHPDKAPDNPFAAEHFRELQEAYEVLSNAAKRSRFDEERWLRGLSKRTRNAGNITPAWVLGEATRLRQHMATVDTYRMNHAALRDYIGALLSPEHLSILQGAPDVHGYIIKELLSSAKGLRYVYTKEVAQKLYLLAGDNEDNKRLIREWVSGRNYEAKWDKYRPIIVIAFALIICAIIWLLK